MTQLLSVENLHVRFHGKRNLHAINGVSFDLKKGQSLGIIGESGSGKSVTLRALLKLFPRKGAEVSGRVSLQGQDIGPMLGPVPKGYRGRDVAMVFQDSSLALDPLYTIGAQIAESIRYHEPKTTAAQAQDRAVALLRDVGIPSPEMRVHAFPHEMSGGMRQRAMIAIALAVNPKLLLADEPTTALDTTVQIQVLLLLRKLQIKRGMSTIFVTHDIGAAIEVSDLLAVMYAGQIVEMGPTERIINAPLHPYTKALIAANLHGVVRGQRLDAIAGSPPALDAPPAHCPFAPRCKEAVAACLQHLPPLQQRDARSVRCLLV